MPSSESAIQPPVLPRGHYTLKLSRESGCYVVQAEPSPGYKFLRNSRGINDFQFNLSMKIGNNDGKLQWGGMGFDKTEGQVKFTLSKKEEQPGGPCSQLTGTLVDFHGMEHPATLDLDDQLHIVEYVDLTTSDTYHKLTEKEPTPGRTLVLCFDGTSNHFSHKNTNVVKLTELLKKDAPSLQMVYYQTGVGTYSPPGLTTTAGRKIASTVDEGLAWYLYQHVIDGYKYLMQTYRTGDKIAIFGFSRGAYTARALAGMLHCVGLLPRHNPEHVPFAYEVYKNAEEKDENIDVDEPGYVPPSSDVEGLDPKQVNPKEFKRAFSVPVTIHFVGVWDTVASVGAYFPQPLPYIQHNPSIMTFRQALALDERRGSFIPTFWDHRKTSKVQDVREVWFRGEHSDVGGGSAGPCKERNPPYSMLSNISLRWMIRQIVTCDTGILFNRQVVDLYRRRNILETPPDVEMVDPAYWKQRMESSIKLDEIDIQHEIYDSIGWGPLWNGIEYLGLTAKSTGKNDSNDDYTRWPNRAKGRPIYLTRPDAPIYIHSSAVDWMMVADKVAPRLKQTNPKRKEVDYKPRAKWNTLGKDDWPCIEDISSTIADACPQAKSYSGFPKSAQNQLTVNRPADDTPTKSWWPF